jgi:hypothetical protein
MRLLLHMVPVLQFPTFIRITRISFTDISSNFPPVFAIAVCQFVVPIDCSRWQVTMYSPIRSASLFAPAMYKLEVHFSLARLSSEWAHMSCKLEEHCIQQDAFHSSVAVEEGVYVNELVCHATR